MTSIAENLDKAVSRLHTAANEAGRDKENVQLLAVSKTKPAAMIREAALAGQKAFGENYLQEALDKIDALSDLTDLEWHFVGPLQSNKTRPVAEHFHWVHSIDRAKVAHRLSEQRPEGMAPLNLCIQVNIDEEPSKAGVRPEEVPALAQTLAGLNGCRFRGLMAIPDPANPPAVQQERFRELAGLLAEVRRGVDNGDLDTLSMGMSGDLEAAIAEGATMVRLGTALFGPRDYEAQ
ncbi:YggS family pyridoxal phosphate-dependent enzyme [Halomonadaceae bacterium KBTZ08]